MCGICGFVTKIPGTNEKNQRIIEKMSEVLNHRGPDDTGYWMDDSGQVAFGHKRLAVIDLSPVGRQPMTSLCGRFTIVFNGEIYRAC